MPEKTSGGSQLGINCKSMANQLVGAKIRAHITGAKTLDPGSKAYRGDDKS